MRLLGKTILITGSSGGIGSAMVEAFLREGAFVVATDMHTGSLVRSQEGEPANDRLLVRQLDVTKQEELDSLSEELENAGVHVNVLVNNAATISLGKILDTSIEDLRRVFSVNFEGAFNVTKRFMPGMIARGGGNILSIASIAAVRALHERFAYCSSKSAVSMMTRSIAVDYVKDNIRANCICPARVHTPFIERYLQEYYPGEEKERFETLCRYQPVGRMIRADEVASMAVYLCSDESAMVTGSDFIIDGGVMAGDQPQ